MRDLLSGGDLELDDAQEAARRRRPAPGRSSLTAGLIARRAADGSGEADTRGLGALLERSTGGAPVPEQLRGSFEESLGVRLDGVRVHTDDAAAGAAASVGARAFATGQDIYFGAGQYDPSSPAGQHLLAHEVAHTVQQAGAAPQVQTALEVSQPGDASEAEADRAADAMLAGERASVSPAPAAVARTPDGSTPAVDGAAAQPGQAAGPASPDQDAAAQAAGPVKITIKYVPSAGKMEYDAADYQELYRQVSLRADSGKCAGSCECGAVDCDYSGFATKRTVVITVPLEVTVPTWKQRGSASKEHQAKFDAWAASVKVHEEAHLKIYKDGFELMKTLMKGPSEADCDAQYDTQKAKIEKDQDAFDADTSKQPAPLAIPGGIQKIP